MHNIEALIYRREPTGVLRYSDVRPLSALDGLMRPRNRPIMVLQIKVEEGT